MRQQLNIFLVTIFSISMIGAFGQEYDDLYFTKSDRKKQKKEKTEQTTPVTIDDMIAVDSPSDYENLDNKKEMSFLGRQFQETNPTLGVSEESLEYYAPEKTRDDYQPANTQSAYINGTQRNPNFSNPENTVYEEDEPDNPPVIINNYYGNNWNRWNRPRWRFGFGWNTWGGSFWSVSYGNAWGNPWYDPFWDPWWGWNAWGPTWGWNSWAWNAGWGWNSWGNPYWCSPYGYRRPVYIVSNESAGRRVVRSARPVRGSTSTREVRSSRVASGSDVVNRSARSDYRRQQAEYLNRSRSSRVSNTSNTGRSNATNRASNVSTNRNRTGYSSGSSSRSSNYSRSRSSSGSYNRSSSSSSRSSSVRSSGSSRSSSSMGRSGSSSRSSGSRSSGGRSSGSRSRRGN